MTFNMKGSGFYGKGNQSPVKQGISIGSKTYDNLDPEMRSAVEGQLGMPTQKQLVEEKREKDDPNAQNIRI